MSSHHRPSLRGILSDFWRITTAQPRHYAALSILFVLPVTFSPLIYPFLLRDVSVSITQIIVYYLLMLLLGIFTAVSITYATFRGSYGKPARLISSLIRSILVSYLPFLGTKLVSLLFVVWAIGGLPALWRCWDLTKGVRCVSFSMVIFFGVVSVILAKWCSILAFDASRNGVSCLFVAQMIVCVGLWTVLSVYSTAASTLLFVHCKAFHGEDTAAFPIVDDEELGPEYAPLTFD